ncbi:MAG: ABC transporter ATP-binding protein [Endomicrobiales bacterium]|nr:ABC transporter ATP-binding protein [Endomicrobiales bacterium]
MMNLLEIKNLSVEYYRNNKIIPAVRDVSLNVFQEETLAIVGESGCGKSTLAQSILGLIFPGEGRITKGEILYNSDNLLEFSEDRWQAIRGKDISIVFQDPFSSLNPVLTIREQIIETVEAHNSYLSKAQKNEIAENSLVEVMLSDQKRILDSYPHQLSGGQRQRAALAMAIVNRPQMLIADEPTTALDVTIQKEILDLLDKLKNDLSLTLILITHNLPLASQRSQRIAVMYAGEVVELGTREQIFKKPFHPYTKGLLQSIPKLNNPVSSHFVLSGQPPDLTDLPVGCKFWPRCPDVMEICKKHEPEEANIEHSNVKCFLYKK